MGDFFKIENDSVNHAYSREIIFEIAWVALVCVGGTHVRGCQYFSHIAPKRHLYQNMWNFLAHLLIYVKSLSHHVLLLKRPRKS